MKKIILLAIVLISCKYALFAQTPEETIIRKTPSWISEKGYWVTESTHQHPDTTTVYFYNNDNILVYKERLEGVVLNLKKYRVKMRLKSVLEQSVLSYEKERILSENKSLLASLYK